MEKERLEKQIDFILEADKEKNIFRQTHLTENGRRENDAEHAWHMAMMVYLLKEYANEEFDVAKAMLMALIHDIVEIDAGDTFAYDIKGHETKKMREDLAAERIFGLLPEDQGEELKNMFQEYEAYETPEARFDR
ncbi:MAG: HD domain-containing protein, partial [Lachnospiraceae bacterium]|nr:HD domain-containing protein [Lachnospiraceae bacterium]